MVTVSLVQAKAHLSELLGKVEAGEEVIITAMAVRWPISMLSRPQNIR